MFVRWSRRKHRGNGTQEFRWKLDGLGWLGLDRYIYIERERESSIVGKKGAPSAFIL